MYNTWSWERDRNTWKHYTGSCLLRHHTNLQCNTVLHTSLFSIKQFITRFYTRYNHTPQLYHNHDMFDDRMCVERNRERRMRCVPEREDDEACDDEDHSKQDEDVVACVLPSRVVKHLSWLREGEMIWGGETDEYRNGRQTEMVFLLIHSMSSQVAFTSSVVYSM